MKKYLAILLAALLALSCTTALGETVKFVEDSSLFDIEMALPENAAVAEKRGNDQTNMVRITSEGLAGVWISVAYSDIYGDDQSMNDLNDDAVNLLIAAAGLQYDQPEVTVDVTPSGNKYIYICANSDFDVDAIFTLYKGYFIELTQWHDDYSKITEADTEFMKQLLYNIEFTDIK